MSSFDIERTWIGVTFDEATAEAARRVIDRAHRRRAADGEVVKLALALADPPALSTPAVPFGDDAEGPVGPVWLSLNHRYEVHALVGGSLTAVCGAEPFGDGHWRVLEGVAARDAYRCARCERLLREVPSVE